MRTLARIHDTLDGAGRKEGPGRLVDLFLLVLIALNVLALVLETVQPIYQLSPEAFRAFEIASVMVFTAEYILRLVSIPESPAYPGAIRGRLRFAVSPLALVDLLAILPFYLPLLGLDFRFVRVVRLLRLFRIVKLGRYSTAMATMGRVTRARREELIATLSILVVLLVLASSLMYFVENEAQPDKFSSIPHAMWWGVATLTTIGYGDIYPITAFGKVLAGAVAVLGIGMFALPTGILGAAFVEEIQHRRRKTLCPHCGKEIDP